MMTFNQIYAEVQAQAQDYDSLSLVTIKRAINQGMKKFAAVLNREWTQEERTFQTVSSQQFYQMPEDGIRIKDLAITIGSITYHTTNVEDQDFWGELNMRVQTSSVPQFHYVKGADQFGIWPVPNGAYTATLTFEKQARDMTQDDVTSPGTIAITNGASTVTGTSTAFTAAMVGRYIFNGVNDGLGDGLGYLITGFTSATSLTIGNNYGGTTIAGGTYLIGEVPALVPDEFHEALIDYGAYRYYRRRRDLQTAKDLKSAFDEQLMMCEQDYSSKTTSQYVRTPKPVTGFRQFKRDLTIPT